MVTIATRKPRADVSADGPATTLYGVLRGGRHVLVVPTAGVADDPALAPYRSDVDIVTREPGETRGTRPAVLVRPDGHVAARGRPGAMHTVTAYLRGLLGEPAAVPGPVRS
jgi:hypothetical protein